MEDVKKGIGEGELKMSDPELAKKILEDERIGFKAKMEEAEAENAKPPVAFRDAIGRKFNFPFHLVQTWEVS